MNKKVKWYLNNLKRVEEQRKRIDYLTYRINIIQEEINKLWHTEKSGDAINQKAELG